jgi:manganese transport protein
MNSSGRQAEDIGRLTKEETPALSGGSAATNGTPRSRSLEGLHGTVPVPSAKAGFWRQYRAFVGPAFLVSVGYMDPGNWATDLQAGAIYRYGLLWVVGLASLMAIIMQLCRSSPPVWAW